MDARPEMRGTVTYFHRVCKHPGQTEWDLLREFLSMHSDFKTITEIDVDNLSGASFEKKIGWMSVSKTEDVANHTVDRERAGICRSSL
jgi:hypothetical protein